MRRLLQVAVFVLTGIGLVLMTEKQAHAYADPGSSLLILQTVGSVLTATGIYFRRRIASLFRKDKSTEPEHLVSESSASTTGK